METHTLTIEDIEGLLKRLMDLSEEVAEEEEFGRINYERIRHKLDEYEHFGNRRLRTVGELVQEAFRIGMYRMERVVRERMTTQDTDTITPQTVVNTKPVSQRDQGVLRFLAALAVHGPDEYSERAVAPAASLRDGCGWIEPGAGAHRGPRRASDALREDVPDRDAGGSEHRAHRAALHLRDCRRSTASCRRRTGRSLNGKLTDEIEYLSADEEEELTIAQANTPVDQEDRQDRGGRPDPGAQAGRGRGDRLAGGGGLRGRGPACRPSRWDGPDPVPGARRRQPGLDGREHAASGRAAAP